MHFGISLLVICVMHVKGLMGHGKYSKQGITVMYLNASG